MPGVTKEDEQHNMTDTELSKAAARVAAALAAHGHVGLVRELPASTRTAADAALALECTVAQIAKSLVFKRRHSQSAVLVVASGVNQVDTARLAVLCGEPIAKADADFVRTHTGFAIGGIPPFAHRVAVETYLDEDLFSLDLLWAAAGTPNAVFPLTPAMLRELTGAAVVAIKREQG